MKERKKKKFNQEKLRKKTFFKQQNHKKNGKNHLVVTLGEGQLAPPLMAYQLLLTFDLPGQKRLTSSSNKQAGRQVDPELRV